MCVCAPCLCIDRLCVGIVGREVESHGAEDAELGGHLLHPPQSPLLLCVCKLHHKTRRSSLCGTRWISQQQLPIILDYLILLPSFYSFISSIRSRQMFTVNIKLSLQENASMCLSCYRSQPVHTRVHLFSMKISCMLTGIVRLPCKLLMAA